MKSELISQLEHQESLSWKICGASIAVLTANDLASRIIPGFLESIPPERKLIALYAIAGLMGVSGLIGSYVSLRLHPLTKDCGEE